MSPTEIHLHSCDLAVPQHRPLAAIAMGRSVRRAIHHVRQAYDLCVYGDLVIPVLPESTTEHSKTGERMLAWQFHWQRAKEALLYVRINATFLATNAASSALTPLRNAIPRITDLFLGGEDHDSVARRRRSDLSDDDAIEIERRTWEEGLCRVALNLINEGGDAYGLELRCFEVGQALEQILCPPNLESAFHRPVRVQSLPRRAKGLSGERGNLENPRWAFNSAGVSPIDRGDVLPEADVIADLLANIARLGLNQLDGERRSYSFSDTALTALEGVIEPGKSLVNVVDSIADDIARAVMSQFANSNMGESPSWNKDTSELLIGNKLVRKVARRARNCIAVLDVFQEEGWPRSISDPLPGGKDPERVGNTIRTLNNGSNGIRFRAGGDGKSYSWEFAN